MSQPPPSSRRRSGSPGSTSPVTFHPAPIRRVTRRLPMTPAAPVTRAVFDRGTPGSMLVRSLTDAGIGHRSPFERLPIAHRELARRELPDDDLLAGQPVFARGELARERLARGERTRVV